MVARPSDPSAAYCRMLHHARAADEAAGDLDAAELRALASGWSGDRLARAVELLSGAALGLEEAAEVLEQLRERKARLKGGLQ